MEFAFPDDNDQDLITGGGSVVPPTASSQGVQGRKRVVTQQSMDQQAMSALDTTDLV